MDIENRIIIEKCIIKPNNGHINQDFKVYNAISFSEIGIIQLYNHIINKDIYNLNENNTDSRYSRFCREIRNVLAGM